MLSRTTKLIVVVALIAGSLAIGAPPAGATPTRIVKAATGDVWQPRFTHLFRQGGRGKVIWKNPTNRTGGHNVKSVNDGTDWTMPRTHLRNNSKNQASHIFRRPGLYWYVCTIHAARVGGEWRGMFGKIRVH